MRIGVPRLHRPFLGRQILPSVKLVVLVAGALREHCPEDFNVRGNRVGLASQARREALLQITCSRVERVVKVVRIVVEQSAVDGAKTLADVDDVEPRARRELECDLDRGNWHQTPNC